MSFMRTTNFRLLFHSRQLKLQSFQQRLRRDSSLLVLRLNSLLRHVHRRLVPTKRNSDDGASPKIFQLHRFCVPDNLHAARRLQLRSRADNNFHQRRIITWSPLEIRIRSKSPRHRSAIRFYISWWQRLQRFQELSRSWLQASSSPTKM